MLSAGLVARKVLGTLKKQVIEKGYVVEAVLSKYAVEKSRLTDTEIYNKIIFQTNINIIITQHDISLFPIAIGDNPEDFIDFIWISGDNGENDEYSPEEGMVLTYIEQNYIICVVSPAYVGGRLVIKECRARKTR